ncbi:arsenite efflux MFS transporter ArsK [Rhizobium rhododendri]|uniref:Arsenite efflux MFS transporter ArsK n=1 Tax=Rhizobium rhododendri TaxID=2506430 RepID=A0ABY8IJS2_9HYPH|nr:arsenite efflux MFS transporter ArsK [Rhizobium rhododendri]WFS23896.1 arsenite efflux MFS transporter ArsK [Rhizobium rhododendri]
MKRFDLPVAAILGLGVTQIVGYGTLYYSFGILAPDMARDLGASVEWMFGALSAALLIGGFVAPWLGGWIDRFGAGRIMAIGSLIAALALAACALAPNRFAFAVILVFIEAAANFVQYGAAFALLVQINPKVAQRSITTLTLIAGFASTIFWPTTTALHAHLPWREVYVVFSLLNLAICLPIHAWLALSTAKVRRNGAATAPAPVEGALAEGQRRVGFALMVVGFAFLSLVSSAILVHMVPLMASLGLGTMAALVGTVFGPAQVASRVINMVFGRNLHPLRLAALSGLLVSVAIVVLDATAPSTSGAIAFAVLFGFGNGIFSIAAGTLPLYLFGSEGYGRLQGKLMSARLIVGATAPFAFAVSLASAGAAISLGVVAAFGAIATFSFLRIGRIAATPHRVSGKIG